MKTITTTKPGFIDWPGTEPVLTTREEAQDTLKACAFIKENVTVRINGGSYHSLSVARPSGLTDKQAAIACLHLCHQHVHKISRYLPDDAKIDVVNEADGALIEIDDGWTIGPSIEMSIGYRGAIRWHAFDPEGNPLIENTSICTAAAKLLGAIAAYRVQTTWNNEP